MGLINSLEELLTPRNNIFTAAKEHRHDAKQPVLKVDYLNHTISLSPSSGSKFEIRGLEPKPPAAKTSSKYRADVESWHRIATFQEQGAAVKGLTALRSFIGLFGPAGLPLSIVERLSALMVEGNASERGMKLLDTFGLDEGVAGHEEFKRIYAEEGPLQIELVKELDLAPA